MSLPKWTERFKHTASDTAEQLYEALSIAWEALEENVEFNMRDAEGPELRAQNECNYRRSKDAMRRIEELGK